MKLKNILIVVKDVEKSKEFYHDLFGLQVLHDFEENVIMTEGLVLQEKRVWEKLIGQEVTSENNASELYFEENNIDAFLEKLETYKEPICYVNELKEQDWGQRVVRIFDRDGHIIEISESMECVVRRFLRQGMSVEEAAKKTRVAVSYVEEVAKNVKETWGK